MPTVDYDPQDTQDKGDFLPGSFKVAQLPPAGPNKYSVAVVTDATATSGTAAGGSTHYGIVISDGTNWVIVAGV